MVKYYAEKIRNCEINSKTGEAWQINDVPKLWRKKVEIELNEE